MKNIKLSQKAQNYLIKQDEIISAMNLKMDKLPDSECIADNFIAKIAAYDEAQIQMSKILPEYTVYVPLCKLVKNNIQLLTQRDEQMQRSAKECSLCKNTKGARYLYKKRDDLIQKILGSKIDNVVECNNTDVVFIRYMLPLCKSTLATAKNALRFDTCKKLDRIILKIINDEQEKVRRLEYLYHCIVGR